MRDNRKINGLDIVNGTQLTRNWGKQIEVPEIVVYKTWVLLISKLMNLQMGLSQKKKVRTQLKFLQQFFLQFHSNPNITIKWTFVRVCVLWWSFRIYIYHISFSSMDGCIRQCWQRFLVFRHTCTDTICHYTSGRPRPMWERLLIIIKQLHSFLFLRLRNWRHLFLEHLRFSSNADLILSEQVFPWNLTLRQKKTAAKFTILLSHALSLYTNDSYSIVMRSLKTTCRNFT